MVVNRRPNPNAARLFVNWFLSREGQTIMHTKSGRSPAPTFRVDVTEQGKVQKADMRKAGIDYLTMAHDPAIQTKRLASLKRAEEIYRKVRGK
ncbi:MAG: hypothetical protein GTO40_01615 [Deltaproteobacteria bacterium]|nr:hypothetical protein [Deltaproteobacteria bacterium]